MGSSHYMEITIKRHTQEGAPSISTRLYGNANRVGAPHGLQGDLIPKGRPHNSEGLLPAIPAAEMLIIITQFLAIPSCYLYWGETYGRNECSRSHWESNAPDHEQTTERILIK